MTRTDMAWIAAAVGVLGPVLIILGRRLAIWCDRVYCELRRAARIAKQAEQYSTRVCHEVFTWQDDNGCWRQKVVYHNNTNETLPAGRLLTLDEFIPGSIKVRLKNINRPTDDGPITQEEER